MARALNPLSSEKASGSFGNVVTFKNKRSTQVVARKSAPSQPQTSAQKAARATFTKCTRAWASLSPAQVSAWEAYSAEHPRPNNMGDLVVLPAYDAYVKAAMTQMAQFGSAPGSPVPVNHECDFATISAVFSAPLGAQFTWTLTTGLGFMGVITFWLQGPLANPHRALRQPEQRLNERRTMQTSPWTTYTTRGAGWYWVGAQVCNYGVYDRPVRWLGPINIPF